MIAQSGAATSAFSDFGTPVYRINGATSSITTRNDAYNATSVGSQILLNARGDASSWTTYNIIYRSNPTDSFNLTGTIQEVLYYNITINSTTREGIETNINNNYAIYNQTPTGLLATYSGAAAAYSVRQLISTARYAMAVRRASDNAVLPIGFDGSGNLDTATLASFCSGTDGFVAVWYDQSGNANHATQATTANQPKIYDSSTGVIEDNGKPAIDFDGSGDSLKYVGNFLGGSAGSAFSVSSFDNSTRAQREIIFGLQDTVGTRYDFLVTRQATNFFTGPPSAISFYVEGDFQAGASTLTNTDQAIISAIYANNTTRAHYINGVLALSSAVNNLGNLDDGTDFVIGDDINTGASIDGKIQAVIIYNADKSSDRAAIESALNDYFNVY